MTCPDCKCEFPKGYYRLRSDGKVILLPTRPEKKKYYPLILDIQTTQSGQKFWREIYRCQQCKLEIEFTVYGDTK